MGKRSSKSKNKTTGPSPVPCDMGSNERHFTMDHRHLSMERSPRQLFNERRNHQHDPYEHHSQYQISNEPQHMDSFVRLNVEPLPADLPPSPDYHEAIHSRDSPQIIMIPEAVNVESPQAQKPEDSSNNDPPPPPPVPRRRCASCCKSAMSFLVSTVGLTCLMIGYTVMGGFIFMKLEAPNEKVLKSNVLSSRKWHVEMLWNLTYELNILYPDNWTRMADEIMENYTREVYVATKNKGWDGTEGESEVQWSFPGALLYSITVVTTIGYGHIAPRTIWGRFVTIIYALFGIPLTLLTITNLGGFMATTFRFIYKNICCGLCCICCVCCRARPEPDVKSAAVKYRDPQNGDPAASRSLTNDGETIEERQPQPSGPPKKYPLRVVWRKGLRRMMKTEDNKRVSVPITVSVLVMSSYIIAGAVLFSLWEPEWDYLIGAYFCFITLTTIGFGDFVPGTSTDSWANQEKLVLCCFYLLFGLALIAMCFDLMQEEARNMVRALGVKLGIVSKEKNKPPPDEERAGF